jgi:hypothetical protein
MRKTPAAAAACGALALVTACSSAPAQPPRSTGGAAATPPSAQSSPPAIAAAQLTPAQASRAFDTFFPRYDAMVRNHTPSQVATLTTGAQAEVMAFSTAKGTGLTTPAQLTERCYVPRLTVYPRWFVEVGTTRSGGDLFVMVQDQPGGPWRVADTSAWTGPPPSPLSAISLDPRGYAIAAPPAEPSLVTPPEQLPGQYTSLLSGSPRSSFLPYGQGDPTSVWAGVQQRIVKEAPTDGWHVSFRYSVPADSEYALTAAGGGAVVFFAFSQSSTWVSASATPRFSGGATAFDGRMPLLLAVDAGLTSPHVRVGTRFDGTYVFEPLALDPAHGGQITLMDREFDGGGLTTATMGS